MIHSFGGLESKYTFPLDAVQRKKDLFDQKQTKKNLNLPEGLQNWLMSIKTDPVDCCAEGLLEDSLMFTLLDLA